VESGKWKEESPEPPPKGDLSPAFGHPSPMTGRGAILHPSRSEQFNMLRE